jgi:hypothetical protein
LDGRKIDFRWVQDDAIELHSSARKAKGKELDEKTVSVKSHQATTRHKASKNSRNAKVAFATPAKAGKKIAAPKKARKR